ncbi:MAG: hypothetical protein AAGG51_05690 [Cyanobacteria bacterium P01_G01_bin.54]
MNFSIIIPLEFHRGQVERCLRAWAEGQTFPATEFELVVVAPDHLSVSILDRVRDVLRAQDRLLLSSDDHDMGLCVEGAAVAAGDIFFFTESHCWPEPNVLELAQQVLATHPHWAGFSARSLRKTHNRLSEAEADMYEADIEYAMLEHPWRKILDQCFVVRKTAWEESGGFQANLGHFAEWLLAARFYQQGLTVGYAPEICLHHYSIGDFAELEEFTQNFVHGHARFLAEQENDPAIGLCPYIPYWSERVNYLAVNTWPILFLTLKIPLWCVSFSVLFYHLILTIFGCRFAVFTTNFRVWKTKNLLRFTLFFRPSTRVEAMRNYCRALIDAAARLLRSEKLIMEVSNLLPITGSYCFGDRPRFDLCGFHRPEFWQGRSCRWSEPQALIRLPLPPGVYQVRLTWIKMWPHLHYGLRFYWNGQKLTDKLELTDVSLSTQVRVSKHDPPWLGWICRRLSTPNDSRRLGQLMERVEWRRV